MCHMLTWLHMTRQEKKMNERLDKLKLRIQSANWEFDLID